VVWLLATILVLAGAALLIPESPYYLPNLFSSSRHYDGYSARHWIKATASPDHEVRNHAIFALGAIGAEAGEAVPLLATILVEDSSARLRSQAALALSKMDPASRLAVTELGQALADEHPLVRMNSTLALFRLRREARPAIPALIKASREKSNQTDLGAFNFTIQELVILTLGRAGAGTTDAFPTLLEALKGADTDRMRQTVTQALGDVGTEAKPAAPLLREMLKDKNADLQNAARKALEKIEG
jgi:HEAT repeat protein